MDGLSPGEITPTIETAIDRALNRMNLFAGQEQHVAGLNASPPVLRPHHPLAPKNNQGLLIQMAMRLGLRARDIPDELRDVHRAVRTADEDLKKSLGHPVPL